VCAVWKPAGPRVIYRHVETKALRIALPLPQSNALVLEVIMLRWALGFFVIALIAAFLGFSGMAIAAAGIAKILFYIFLVLFVVSLLGHLANRT
jgi:uncharacterized membrane protein YtjA (UPF0391 family)